MRPIQISKFKKEPFKRPVKKGFFKENEMTNNDELEVFLHYYFRQ